MNMHHMKGRAAVTKGATASATGITVATATDSRNTMLIAPLALPVSFLSMPTVLPMSRIGMNTRQVLLLLSLLLLLLPLPILTSSH